MIDLNIRMIWLDSICQTAILFCRLAPYPSSVPCQIVGADCSGFTVIAQAYLSEYLGQIRYIDYKNKICFYISQFISSLYKSQQELFYVRRPVIGYLIKIIENYYFN